MIRGPGDLDALCTGLRGLQREACMTAGSVIGPPDPALQLRICAGLLEASDARSCIRGTKVQNLLGYPSPRTSSSSVAARSSGGPTRPAFAGSARRWPS